MGINSSSDISDLYFEDENLSYYYGFKSTKSEDDFNIVNENKNDIDDDAIGQIVTNKEKKIKIPVFFEWDQGGNSVYVTGNFCNWQQFFLMKKEKNGTFYLNLNLPKGIYQYKYKVDDEWKYNDKYPTCNENGFVNNYIDTTNSEYISKNIEEGTTTGNSSILENNEISKISKKSKNEFSKISKKSLIKSKNDSFLKHKKIYSNYMPNKDELKENIPELPIQYKSCININLHSNQNKIGDNKYIKIHEKNILSDNISFKKISVIDHEQINHLNLNKKQFNKNNKIIISSISSNYRYKYTTFVYYKPYNK